MAEDIYRIPVRFTPTGSRAVAEMRNVFRRIGQHELLYIAVKVYGEFINFHNQGCFFVSRDPDLKEEGTDLPIALILPGMNKCDDADETASKTTEFQLGTEQVKFLDHICGEAKAKRSSLIRAALGFLDYLIQECLVQGNQVWAVSQYLEERLVVDQTRLLKLKDPSEERTLSPSDKEAYQPFGRKTMQLSSSYETYEQWFDHFVKLRTESQALLKSDFSQFISFIKDVVEFYQQAVESRLGSPQVQDIRMDAWLRPDDIMLCLTDAVCLVADEAVHLNLRAQTLTFNYWQYREIRDQLIDSKSVVFRNLEKSQAEQVLFYCHLGKPAISAI